ncbi:MAG: negative regulator for alginate biosynthesis [Halieaceae bacterium]|nr:negative regulator for alginate biosynthesis [Halieaceae bacterium]
MNLRKLHGMQYLLALLAVSVVWVSDAGKVFAAACPEGDAEALDWLDKMAHSAREVDYQGVVTLQRGQDMKVMQVSHSVEGGIRREVLTELTGRGARVQRARHRLDCAHPGLQLLHTRTVGDSCGIAEQYRFEIADGERVAGRRAITIRVKPRDLYRFGYVFSLDEATGLLLKVLTLNPAQHPLETMQFAQLSYGAPVAGLAVADVTHEATHPDSGKSHDESAMARAWSVMWVPDGFTTTEKSVGASRRKTYTDGLAAFSVFVEILDRDMPPGEGHVKQGGTTTYTRGLRLSNSPVLVTVIGEVPLATARMVADSVRWVR